MRLTYDQLNIIKDKLGVKKMWSYSKISTFLQCLNLYKLKYIDKEKGIRDSCYTHFGTVSHDTVQGYYEGKSKSHEDMVKKWNEAVLKWKLDGKKELQFTSDDERDHYIANMEHYFKNTNLIDADVVNEEAVLAIFFGKEKYVFQGYIDSKYTDKDGNLVILDYKTSSISGFSGKGLFEKSKQLLIYAIGMNQFHNIPFEKIKLRYDMMKYVNVTFKQKNGNYNTTKAERRAIVAKISGQIRKKFKMPYDKIAELEKEIKKLTRKMNAKCRTPEEVEGLGVAIGDLEHEIKENEKFLYSEEEITKMIEDGIEKNSMADFPQFIQDEFKIDNCYIDVPVTEEYVGLIRQEVVKALDKITELTAMEDKEEAFKRDRIQDSEQFYCTNLCDMRNKCELFKEMKEHQGMFIEKEKSDEEILAMLGL